MKDIKKSKKDNKNSGDASDIDLLFDDIADAKEKSDQQIKELEDNRNEIKGLDSKLATLDERLSDMEGEARAKVEEDIRREQVEKEAKAQECEQKLNEIALEMTSKQTEIKGEITKRDTTLSELQEMEQEDEDLNFDSSKESVSDEKNQLQDANNQIQELTQHISTSIEKNQLDENLAKTLKKK